MAASLTIKGQGMNATLTQLSIAICSLIATVPCYAEELSDPTQPPSGIYSASSEQGAVSEKKLISPTNNGLQSIIIAPKRRAAIINGKTVELGEVIGKAKLVEVSESGVVLQDTRSRRVLALFPGVNLTVRASNEAIEHAVPEENK